ncbi:MAG: hypothetical protein CSA45_04265 [Gammaproteobacteria bacterium]|nr:MAG: hypothetical protein CSA45_04265 [Gammaproteobacteria bacterium]
MTLLSNQQIQQTLALAEQAGKEIMAFYDSGLDVQIKGDQSPVTQADFAASSLLESALPDIADYPVLSEENIPNIPAWRNWPTYWLIDPVDGTKHFINGTGEFCICISLICHNQVVFGLIFAPATRTAWFAQKDEKSLVYKQKDNKIEQIAAKAPKTITATLSSTHLTDNMQALLNYFPDYRWHRRGSALKYVDLIEGRATLYPKMWDTCEWDSAAGQCLVECAGGEVINFTTGRALSYGSRDSLVNPHFLAYCHLPKQQVKELLNCYQRLDIYSKIV